MLAIGRGDRAHPFLIAGLAVAAADLGVVTAFGLLGAHDMTAMLQLAAASVGCAMLSAVIALGSFALMGNLFGILTPPQLLELANPSRSAAAPAADRDPRHLPPLADGRQPRRARRHRRSAPTRC